MTSRGPGFSAQVATLRLLLPERQPHNIGVLLLDLTRNALYWRLVRDWRKYADEDDVEVLQALDETLRLQVAEIGGSKFFKWIENTWSNALMLADQQEIEVRDCKAELDRLFEERVGPD